ncbi:GntR family transcriptional regulator [Advenella mimigardefordensis]|uniref:Transcriptional regulator, GntR family n=1 Tax=Advenella mimigardefordensis (strain DSM 17166 / LMG 22922 / DPN7) TaxID=1247726 RepID=W0PCX2_ADVMD|nr:GntR family transcriptional regulator [Advenella mimigardefordensis]AHG64606.1 transcriptional regulator, GntR family [Advenella mimigardefordensis DPN7]
MKSEQQDDSSKTTIPMRIAEELRHLIYAGQIKPGERLNEAVLAQRMGTSRSTIREAIRSLLGFGLVTAVPNRGAYVRQLSVREMVEISDLRALVFGFAAGLAAEHRSASESELLRDIVEQMDQAAEAGDMDGYYHLNLSFHAHIVGLARSERTERLYNDFVKELHLFRRQNFDNVGNMRRSNAEHRSIYEAIAKGDKTGATRCAEQHILAGCQRMLRTMDGAV